MSHADPSLPGIVLAGVDQVMASTTPVADNTLILPLEGQATYAIEGKISFERGLTGGAQGVDWDFTFSGTPREAMAKGVRVNTLSVLTDFQTLPTGNAAQINFDPIAVGIPVHYYFTGVIIVSVAGDWSIEFAQTSGGGATIGRMDSSYLKAKRIGFW